MRASGIDSRTLCAALFFVAAVQAQAATLVVGPGKPDLSIQQAAQLAKDGDTVELRPGIYRGGVAVWTQKALTIRGTGDRPIILANGQDAEGKAIWVIRGGDITVENIAFKGARVADGNGAGIRFERGRLTVKRCVFEDNETGILTANRRGLELTIEDSVFRMAPTHPGRLHHLLYVGAIDRFSVSGSRFQQGFRGHLVKSRAKENHVQYNLIHDNGGGSASYELEFPNGGVAFVIGNVIGQSAATENPIVISFGAEGNAWPDSALYLSHNTLLNERPGGATFLRVWTHKLPRDMELLAINNLIVGPGTFSAEATGKFEGNVQGPRELLQDAGALSLELPAGSPLHGAGVEPGQARGRSLVPRAEFVLPVGTRVVAAPARYTPGAFQGTAP